MFGHLISDNVCYMYSFFIYKAFVRDPDGYYIEFCNCQILDKFLHDKMAEEAKIWNFSVTKSVLTVGKKLKMIAKDSKTFIKQSNNESLNKVILFVFNIKITTIKILIF